MKNHGTLFAIVLVNWFMTAVHSKVGPRVHRASSWAESSSQKSKPELKATHKEEFTILTCTVKSPQPDVNVFIWCPALGGTTNSGICYQGCQPSNRCPKFGDPHDPCVPNESTVFCEERNFSNGTRSLTLKINRTDTRLSGLWSCSHAELESTKFEITAQKETQEQQTPIEKPVNSALNGPSAEPPSQSSPTSDEQQLNQRPMAFLRQPPVLFSVLAVLVVSLLINLAFCIRCMLMRSYIDASQDGSSQANCLASCLCLPKDVRKTQTMHLTPILPRSNWGTQPNLNGSYQGSAQLVYPSPGVQKMPLLMGQQSPTDLSGASYFPAGSLPGTLRKQQRMYAASQLDAFNNSHMAYQSAGQDNIDPLRSLFQSTNEMAGVMNYFPQYVRAPSINTPSPNLSHRLPPAPGANNPFQTQNNVDGTGGPQYFIRMPGPMIGGHVIYDDVAAGTSSMLNAYCRNPNEGTNDSSATILQLPTLYSSNPIKAQQSAESTPLLASNMSPGSIQVQLGNHVEHGESKTATSNAQALLVPVTTTSQQIEDGSGSQTQIPITATANRTNTSQNEMSPTLNKDS